MFNPAILSVDGANQFHRSNKAALCRTKENIMSSTHFRWLFAFLNVFFFLFCLYVFMHASFFSYLCVFFSRVVFSGTYLVVVTRGWTPRGCSFGRGPPPACIPMFTPPPHLVHLTQPFISITDLRRRIISLRRRNTALSTIRGRRDISRRPMLP